MTALSHQPAPASDAPNIRPHRRTLYEITSDLLALEDLLIEAGGDVSDEAAAQAVDQWLSSLGEERDAKLNGYCWLIREIEARVETRKMEAARLSALAKVDENAAKRLKDRMKVFMELTRATKIETEHFKIGVQANGGKQAVEIDPELQAHPDELPEEFQRWTVAPDIDAIRAAIEGGSKLTFASIVPRGTHIRIR